MIEKVVFFTLLSVAIWHFIVRPKSLRGPITPIGNFNIRFDTLNCYFESYGKTEIILTGSVGLGIYNRITDVLLIPDPCEHGSSVPGSHCFQWPEAKLEILHNKQAGDKCYQITWTAMRDSVELKDCFSLKYGYLYGGSEMYHQRWPATRQKPVSMDAYQSGDIYQAGQFGSVLERYWLFSKGLGVYVDDDVPLHVSINENYSNDICFKSSFKNSEYKRLNDEKLKLKYTICQDKDIKSVHELMYPKFYDLPTGLPDERFFKSPVWSTWARYKAVVNETDVLQYATEIKQKGFSNSQIEIDDVYTTHYGEFVFDQKKFPSGKGLIDKLHKLGFRVTSWVTPFANIDSPAFLEGDKKGYWVKEPRGEVTALVKWWQGVGGMIDVTNPEAVDWFVSRLQKFQEETGMDSFKFDAGETNFFPVNMSTHVPLKKPGEFTTKYIDMVSKFGGLIEVRCGFRSQKYPIFTRMMDKDSNWSFDNGFKTMIPTALLMSVLGYHFDLPDMIGGNAYENASIGLIQSKIPGKELFIRWTQLTAYLPSMQFSIAPWQYDEETTRISKEMVKQHEEIVTPIILKGAREATTTVQPIIRPLWWHDPQDEECLTSETQFLVGGSLLVAPIVEGGARSRDVYIPRGTWTDNLRGGVVKGPTWLREYKVELSEISTFTLT